MIDYVFFKMDYYEVLCNIKTFTIIFAVYLAMFTDGFIKRSQLFIRSVVSITIIFIFLQIPILFSSAYNVELNSIDINRLIEKKYINEQVLDKFKLNSSDVFLNSGNYIFNIDDFEPMTYKTLKEEVVKQMETKIWRKK